MRWTDVRTVLDGLTDGGVRAWVVGGWGIAALVGRQTREHHDLDLLVDADDLAPCLAALADLGYRADIDHLPVRIELAADGERRVDLHPVVFDAHGDGMQAGYGATTYDYPADCFTVGTIRGNDVPCLSAGHQRQAHAGYEPRPQDRHDLAQLDRVGL